MDVVGVLMNYKQNYLDVSGIHITPPPISMDSDEDSASEDKGETFDNLKRRQLHTGAKIALTDGQRISNKEEIREVTNPTSIMNQPKRSISQDQWTDDDLFIQDSLFPDQTFQEYQEFTPIGFYGLFVDDNVVNFLVK